MIRTSINNVGFLFGAGTSFESGYPLIAGLAKGVVEALHTTDRAALDEVLAAFHKTYDTESGAPNIEEILDMAIEHHIDSQLERFEVLKEQIRTLLRGAIPGVENPNISNSHSG